MFIMKYGVKMMLFGIRWRVSDLFYCISCCLVEFFEEMFKELFYMIKIVIFWICIG